MYKYRWKYMVQVQKPEGGYTQGIVWAVYPRDFRAFLRYVNGEDGRRTITPPETRVRRVPDDAAPNFTWPTDAVLD